HETELTKGSFKTGDRVRAAVFADHRLPTMRNHTATHLLHWALRRVLGKEVEQRGSLVAADRLRFDFTYPRAVPADLLTLVERLVNEQVLKNLPVSKEEKALEEAKRSGAIALFGEKYGERVRVVSVQDADAERRSVELCGGTHCERTGDIGAFKIVSESSIAAGVRRIEAITGLAVLGELDRLRLQLLETARVLKVDLDAVPGKVEALQAELKKLKKDLEKAQKSGASDHLQEISAAVRHVDGADLYAASVAGLEQDALMGLADRLKQGARLPAAIVLLSEVEGRVNVLVVLNQGLADRGVSAGDLCRDVAAIVGGKGGGNPLMARGQGKEPAKIPVALERCHQVLRDRLGAARS
ncbi:MAG: DHHA1 domain-containing protein, partial [Planctomycetota bacterium]